MHSVEPHFPSLIHDCWHWIFYSPSAARNSCCQFLISINISCPEHIISNYFPLSFGSYILTAPSSIMFPETKREWNKYSILIQAFKHSLFWIVMSHHIHHISLLREPPWLRLTVTFVCVSKHKCLEGSFMPYILSYVTILRFPSIMTSSVMGFDWTYSIRNKFLSEA